MSNTKHLNLKDFEKSEIIEQVYAPSLMKGRGKEKLIGELDKAGKNVKTANGWVPVKGNEHLVTGGHISDTGTTRWSLKDFKVDSLIHFNDGEVWQVVKESTLHTHDRKKDDGIKIKPYNELAKKRNTSLQINVDLEYLNKNATKVVSAAETKTEVSVHPDIQSELDNYKGGTIPAEVLVHLSAKYADKQPIETFSSVHGAPIKVYGKEGNNYAINFGGARGIILATEADMDALRGKKKEIVETKQEVKVEKPTVQLSGTDGNVFAIIGRVSGALKKAGQADKAKEFTERAFKAGSYDEVLHMLHSYVDAK